MNCPIEINVSEEKDHFPLMTPAQILTTEFSRGLLMAGHWENWLAVSKILPVFFDHVQL